MYLSILGFCRINPQTQLAEVCKGNDICCLDCDDTSGIVDKPIGCMEYHKCPFADLTLCPLFGVGVRQRTEAASDPDNMAECDDLARKGQLVTCDRLPEKLG